MNTQFYRYLAILFVCSFFFQAAAYAERDHLFTEDEAKQLRYTDDEWKKCHDTFQKKAKALMQKDQSGKDPDDPECVKRLKGGKSSQVTDD